MGVNRTFEYIANIYYLAENKHVVRFLFIFICMIMWGNAFSQSDKYAAARNDMVNNQIINRGITDVATIKAMRKVPRHYFVLDGDQDIAYGDFPLSIGYGQTISQPYIVALMTEVVNPAKKKKALEIGTGSGYQAAVLSEIIDSVYTIEIVQELAIESAERLKRLGYKNIIVRSGDGYYGWPERAPFDIIIVTAAAIDVPKPLIDQLAENGNLVIPIGDVGMVQELILVSKKNGKIKRTNIASVRFVPFRRSEKRK